MEIYATSKEVAKMFDRSHRGVLNSIKRLGCSEEFRELNFNKSSYKWMNKTFECYEMTRNGWFLLCMGFKGKKAAQLKVDIINQFNSMYERLEEQHGKTKH